MIQVSIETTGQLERRMNVVVPSKRVEDEMKKRLQKLTQTARIEGFRPGKVPMNLISQRYGDAVRHEVMEAMLKISMNEALSQENLVPATIPVIQSMEMEKDNSLRYAATFEIFPEVQVQDISDIRLEKEIVDIAESDVDTVLEQIRTQQSTWKIVSRSAQKGDQVTVDLHWMSDENPPQAREQKNIPWVLEEGALPIDISKLEGVKASDEVTIDIPLQNAGKTSIPATIKVISVAERELPTLDDAFAKKMDVQDLAALRDQVREHMTRQVNDSVKNKLKSHIIEKLLDKHTIELPKGLVEEEIKNLEQNVREQYAKGANPETVKQALKTEHAQIEKAARRRVTLSVIFNALVKKFNLVVDNARVQERLRYFASMFQDPMYGVDMVNKDSKLMSAIRSQVLEDQIIDKLLEQISFSEKKINYSSFIKSESSEAGDKSHPSDRPAK